MSEYTYKDVIIDPKDPRVEIGKKYYFALGVQDCIDYANRGVKERTLERIDESLYNPFIGDGKDYPFIIRKKEPTYEEQQAEWVKANNLKEGDRVQVLRTFEGGEQGFNFDIAHDTMDELVGKTLKVRYIETSNISVWNEDESDYWVWPYYCLEKVDEPQFKVGDFVKEKETGQVGMIIQESKEGFFVYRNNLYRTAIPYKAGELEPVKAHLEPFDLAKEKDRGQLKGKWIRRKDNREIKLIWWFWELDGKWMIDEDINPQELLNDWVFENGSPCGIVVED